MEPACLPRQPCLPCSQALSGLSGLTNQKLATLPLLLKQGTANRYDRKRVPVPQGQHTYPILGQSPAAVLTTLESLFNWRLRGRGSTSRAAVAQPSTQPTSQRTMDVPGGRGTVSGVCVCIGTWALCSKGSGGQQKALPLQKSPLGPKGFGGGRARCVAGPCHGCSSLAMCISWWLRMLAHLLLQTCPVLAQVRTQLSRPNI